MNKFLLVIINVILFFSIYHRVGAQTRKNATNGQAIITASNPTGIITACEGSPSASPNIQQFIVSGSNLPTDITATAPTGFEISLSAGGGYSNNLSIALTGNKITNQVVYVRSAANASPGFLSGDLVLTSGAVTQNVTVTGKIDLLPTVNLVPNQIVNNGASTTAVNFTGSTNTYAWINDTPSIGLAASGIDNIASFTAINTGSSVITATIKVTPLPFGGFAYIANSGSGTVSVINLVNNNVVATIPVGKNPQYVAASADGSKVYVADPLSDNISVINAATNVVVNTIPLGVGAYALAVSPDGQKIYCAIEASDGIFNVAVISTATNSVIQTIPIGTRLDGITISPDGNRIYIAETFGSSVLVYSTVTNQQIGTISTGSGPYGIALSPDSKRVYITNANFVSVIDAVTNSIITTIPVGYNPRGISVTPDGSLLYVTNFFDGTVSVISTLTNIVTTIKVGTTPFGISISPDGGFVYVVNNDDGTVSVISVQTNAVIDVVPVGKLPVSFGNFIASDANCPGVPVSFTITVKPTPAIIASTTTGTIAGCAGTPSSTPNVQQFTVSGVNLITDITATAPTGFEVSLSEDDGYGNSITIPQLNGAVSNTLVYVRSSATAVAGNISGNVVLSSTGGPSVNIAVAGVVNALPTVNQPVSPTYKNGQKTEAINFTGTANSYVWTNDNPAIGLAASGTGNLPSFTAINVGDKSVKANITVTPLPANDSNCQGKSVTFTITVDLSIIIPNAFTPNGDGKNDTWDIKNLDTYPNCSVIVYNRYGERVYSSPGGYGTSWNGTCNGTNLPFGTYYYIIDLKNGDKVFSGYVTIIR